MKVTIITERGDFTSEDLDYQDPEELLNAITKAASGDAKTCRFNTDQGCIFIGADLLKTAVFVVED